MRSLLYLPGRAALAYVFVREGLDVMAKPEPRVKVATPVIKTIREKAPVGLPEDDVLLVRANAAAQVVAGAALALGFMPRVAAGVLIGSLVATTWGGHRFWEMEDESAQQSQKIHFEKNLGLLGGLLVVVASGGKKH